MMADCLENLLSDISCVTSHKSSSSKTVLSELKTAVVSQREVIKKDMSFEAKSVSAYEA